MLTYWDLLLVALCHYALNLAQPFIDKGVNFLVSKIGEKMVTYGLNTIIKNYIPKKKKKSKAESPPRNPNDKRTPKNIDLFNQGVPILIQQYQNGGVEGIFNMFGKGIMGILQNGVKVDEKPVVVVSPEIKEMDDNGTIESNEQELLENYRRMRSPKNE